MDSGRRLGVKATFDPVLSGYVCKVSHIPEGWRDRIATITGDVVHNLRSALDHLAWRLVVEGSGEPPEKKAKRIYFPIYKHCNKFSDDLAIRWMTAKHRNSIKPLQPFTQPDPDEHPLAILQDLSNQDKHCLLTPILVREAGFSVGSLIEEIEDLPLYVDSGNASERLEVGSELGRVWVFPAGMEKIVERKCGVIPGLWLERTNKILDQELRRLADFVQGVLNCVEAA